MSPGNKQLNKGEQEVEQHQLGVETGNWKLEKLLHQNLEDIKQQT